MLLLNLNPSLCDYANIRVFGLQITSYFLLSTGSSLGYRHCDFMQFFHRFRPTFEFDMIKICTVLIEFK